MCYVRASSSSPTPREMPLPDVVCISLLSASCDRPRPLVALRPLQQARNSTRGLRAFRTFCPCLLSCVLRLPCPGEMAPVAHHAVQPWWLHCATGHPGSFRLTPFPRRRWPRNCGYCVITGSRDGIKHQTVAQKLLV